MIRAYIDSNVFLYAIGAPHRYRDACRALLEATAERRLRGEVGVEVLQEVVHHRRRRGDPEATSRARQAAAICLAVHELTPEDMVAALGLIDRHPELPTRDALHAATALQRGMTVVVSADADFDVVPGLRRVDPLDRTAVATLTG